MKTSSKMQEVITRIAEQYGLDLEEVGAYLRLEIPHSQPLLIHMVGKNLVTVAHYDEPEHTELQVGDPEIVFLTGKEGWAPIEVSQAPGGSQIYALLTPDTEEVVYIAPQGQAHLAEFADTWAENIQAQVWVDHDQESAPFDGVSSADAGK